MAKIKLRVGDKVRVTGMSPVTFPPGVKDELGTEKLFKSMLGKVDTVRGFDKYGNVQLVPKRVSTVWVEPEFLKLVASSAKKRNAKQSNRKSRLQMHAPAFCAGNRPIRAKQRVVRSHV